MPGTQTAIASKINDSFLSIFIDMAERSGGNSTPRTSGKKISLRDDFVSFINM